MEIFVFDENLTRLGFVEVYEYLRWVKRYAEEGEFALKAPVTDNNLALIGVIGNFIWKNDDGEVGIIETLELSYENGQEFITVSGRFASCLIGRRIIWETMHFNSDISVCVGNILQNQCISPSNSDRAIERLLYIQNNLGYKITSQVSYQNCLEVIKNWCELADCGFRTVFDNVNRQIFFELYAQETKPCIFAKEYENVLSEEYSHSRFNLRTVALVKGEEDEDIRATVVVGGGAGNNRYELYVDAKDLQSEIKDNNGNVTDNLSESEYEELLIFRGEQKLAEKYEVISFDANVNTRGNIRYKTDYDLGDSVIIQSRDWGVSLNVRITEITETYDRTGLSLELTFGKGFLTLAQKIGR